MKINAKKIINMFSVALTDSARDLAMKSMARRIIDALMSFMIINSIMKLSFLGLIGHDDQGDLDGLAW